MALVFILGISLIFLFTNFNIRYIKYLGYLIITFLIYSLYTNNQTFLINTSYILYLTINFLLILFILELIISNNLNLKFNKHISKLRKNLIMLAYKYRNNIYTSIVTLFSLRIVYLLFSNIVGMWQFYMNFFIQPELRKFLLGPGIWYMVSLVIVIVAYFTFLKKIPKSITLLASLIFLLVFWMRIDFAFTNEIRDKVWIWEVTPRRGTLWDTVKIKGANFGDPPWLGTVLINGASHRVVSWNNKFIEIELHPGISKSGNIEIVVHNGKVSNPMYFEVYDFFTNEIIN